MNDVYTLTKIMIKLNSGGMCFNQIKKAVVLRSITRGEIERYAVVIQQPHQVMVLEDDSRVTTLVNKQAGETLLHRPMLSGMWERCYFIMVSERAGNEIMLVQFDDLSEQVTCRSAYKQKDTILHF